MESITILGSGRQFSSLDFYSMELSSASGFKRIMLKLEKNQLDSDYEGNPEVQIGRFPKFAGSGWSFNIQCGSYIFRELRKRLEESIVHYSTFGLPLLTDNAKDIVTIHDLFFLYSEDEAYGGFISVPKHFLNRFRKFSNVLAPTNHIKKELQNYGFEGNVTVLNNPIQATFSYLDKKTELREELGFPKDKKLVLSVSSLLRRKNLGVVEDTIQRLGHEYKLVRVGPPIGDSINFSRVSPVILNKIYNACDVLLFPTLREGFGFPVVEAFATGLPVVTSDIEVMGEVAGDAALLVEPDTEHCVSGVKEALSTSVELRNKGLERSKQFSQETFKKNVVNYYASLLKD